MTNNSHKIVKIIKNAHDITIVLRVAKETYFFVFNEIKINKQRINNNKINKMRQLTK